MNNDAIIALLLISLMLVTITMCCGWGYYRDELRTARRRLDWFKRDQKHVEQRYDAARNHQSDVKQRLRALNAKRAIAAKAVYAAFDILDQARDDLLANDMRTGEGE